MFQSEVKSGMVMHLPDKETPRAGEGSKSICPEAFLKASGMGGTRYQEKPG